MKRSATLAFGMFAILLALALSACGERAALAPVAPMTLARLATFAGASWGGTQRPDRSPSWTSPDLKASTQLIFVSDSGTDDVYMYELPSLKLAGTITGFQQPQGECSDNKGDVWIADTNAQTTYEVSHQGRLENTVPDSSGYPIGCAWDPKSGDLAVTNLFDLNGTRGSVLIYANGSKLPKTHVNPDQYYYDFAGYDAKGNLFFDGRSESGAFMLSELRNGAKSATTIAISGQRLYFPGMVQMSASGGKLLVGDQECGQRTSACVYELTVSGTNAKIAGTVKLANAAGGAVCDLIQGVETGGEVAGSDWEFCGFTATTTDLWPFPAGGKPTADNKSVDNTPVGAALSTVK